MHHFCNALSGRVLVHCAKECTPDFHYAGNKGAEDAYFRSKLGNLWWVKEWTKRYKGINAYAVHPGVVASNLGGEASGFARWVRSKIMISTEEGSQTSLLCATQNSLIPGEYYHNTMGHVKLRSDDPGSNTLKAAELWETLEEITADYVE